MTIILKFFLNFIKKKKYDNWQYDNYFKKNVIFEFQNMTTTKKPMPPTSSKISPKSGFPNALKLAVIYDYPLLTDS